MSIRNESKSREGVSPFYIVAGVAIVALTVMGFIVAAGA